jgi:hypothetical protein
MLFKEKNIVSLRTAYVSEHKNRNLVSLSLSPIERELRESWGTGPIRLDWVSKDIVYLYRYMIAPSEEMKLMQSVRSWELQLKPLKFERTPEYRLCWSDSGNSVALYLDGEPWAFICEGNHSGYSKGILRPLVASMPKIGNQWDQTLFERTFVQE